MSVDIASKELCGRVPPRIDEARGRPAQWLILSFLVLVAGAGVLYFFNPTQFSFYPTCLFYKTTGLLCPGCGTLRAIHHLLHGHIQAAFRFNALLVSSLPILAAGFVQAARYRAANKPALVWIRPSWLWVALVILIAFGILRNFPGASDYFLAPL
jgi:hypothetical protein